MATPTNYWKLGLFVVVGLVVALVAVVYFGTGRVREQSLDYKTYFDESVQGLEVGAPVRFRGVTVGRVSEIRIAPDRRLVEVTCALSVRDLKKSGLAPAEGHSVHFVVPPDLRAQLVVTGLTGVEVLSLDFVDPGKSPPIALSFPQPEHYIPSTTSTLKRIEDAVESAADHLPELVDTTTHLIGETAVLVGQLSGMRLGDHANATFRRLDSLLGSTQRTVEKLNAADVGGRAAETLLALNAAFEHLDQLLGAIGGDKGLVTSAQRATDAVGDIARTAHGVGPELEDTLREVRDTAASIKRFVDALEREPDMLVKGRAKKSTP